jgi:hypothetical protein
MNYELKNRTRRLVLAALCCLLLPKALFGTTVTGTVKDSQGNPVSGAVVRFELENCGAGGVCTLTGGGGIVSTLPVSTTTASDGTFSIFVNGNDTMTPSGTFYEVRYIASSGTIYSANYNVTGTTFNLNTATPLGAMPPAPIAAAYTTVAQGGTNLQQRQIVNFTGSGISCVDNSGVPRTDCTVTAGGGSGTVTSVGLSLPVSVFGVSGSPVTASGTLTGSFNTQPANLVFAGPSSGAAAAPAFRALAGADLPVPSSTTPGGVQSFAAVAHSWINAISTSGVPSASQPGFTDLAGSLSLSQTPLTTQGDLLYANATPALARLAIGTNGQCLTSNGTTVSWGSCAAGSGVTLQTNGTNNTSQTTLNLLNSSATNGLTLTHTNTSAGNVQLGISGTLTVPGGGTGLTSLGSHSLYVGNGASNPNPVATGNAGQVLISNGASADPTFQDPIVSYSYANLFNAASATSTQTSALTRVSTFSGFGTLYVTYASITGSPAGCTLQLKNADSLGNLISNGAAISTTPANGTTSSAVLSASGLQTEGQIEAVYACSTYPTAGTVSVDYVPGLSVGIVNTPSVAQSGTWTVQPGNTANTTAWLVTDSTLELVQASTTSGQKGALVQGAVTTSAPTYTTAQTDPLSLTTAGALRVDGSGVTQPVSGTVTANAGTGTFNIQANASVNVAQVNGSTVSTSATGVQKVGIVGNAGASVDAATGAAPPANAVLHGGLVSGATGGLVGAMPICDSYANINISTATTTLEVTGVSGRQVRVCALHIIAAAADNVAVIEGTGATCGTGSAGMAGGTTAATGYNLAANGGLALGSGLGTVMRTATAGDSVCIVTSAATQLSGGISYVIY